MMEEEEEKLKQGCALRLIISLADAIQGAKPEMTPLQESGVWKK